MEGQVCGATEIESFSFAGSCGGKKSYCAPATAVRARLGWREVGEANQVEVTGGHVHHSRDAKADRTMSASGGGGVGQWLIDLVMKPGTSLQLVRVHNSRNRMYIQALHSGCVCSTRVQAHGFCLLDNCGA